jgi:hypothetical protein
MSRVEPLEEPTAREAREGRDMPSQPEGDERTVDEALRNEEQVERRPLRPMAG